MAVYINDTENKNWTLKDGSLILVDDKNISQYYPEYSSNTIIPVKIDVDIEVENTSEEEISYQYVVLGAESTGNIILSLFISNLCSGTLAPGEKTTLTAAIDYSDKDETDLLKLGRLIVGGNNDTPIEITKAMKLTATQYYENTLTGEMVGGYINDNGVAKPIVAVYQNVNGNATLVWQAIEEGWAEFEGSLFKMTSDSEPYPYAATAAGFSDGHAYMAFDNDETTYLSTNNPNGSGTASDESYLQPFVKIMFGREIRIAELKSKIGHGAGAIDYSNWFHIYGIKSDGTEVELGVNSSTPWNDPDYVTHSISLANQQIPFVGLVAHREKGSAGYYYFYDLQVTKWFEEVLWEYFSETKTNPSSITSSGYVTSQYVQFTVTDDVIIEKVSCTAYVYDHTSLEPDGTHTSPTVYATIECSDDGSMWTQVAKSQQIGGEGFRETFSISTSYTWEDGCPYKYIRCYSRGDSWSRQARGIFSGKKRSE